MFPLEEEFVRRRFRLLAHRLGVPDSSRIGQHEIVDSATLEALDAAGHDSEIFVRNLAGKNEKGAVSAFLAFRDGLQTKGLRELSEEAFRSGFFGRS
jgi:hypothetical protein